MASEVDICNMALGHIGQDANVSAIDPPDGSAEADHCARFYPMARDEILESHAWRFATRRAQLAAVDVPDEVDSWDYAYQLPNQCIRPLAVFLPESTDDTAAQDFTVETDSTGNDILYTNVEDAVLKYIARVEDTTKFSPLFTIALARLLAHYLAGPITKASKMAAAQRAALRAGGHAEGHRLGREQPEEQRLRRAPHAGPPGRALLVMKDLVRSFAGGEITPELFGRVDLTSSRPASPRCSTSGCCRMGRCRTARGSPTSTR
jgi:hypothetical protein